MLLFKFILSCSFPSSFVLIFMLYDLVLLDLCYYSPHDSSTFESWFNSPTLISLHTSVPLPAFCLRCSPFAFGSVCWFPLLFLDTFSLLLDLYVNLCVLFPFPCPLSSIFCFCNFYIFIHFLFSAVSIALPFCHF